MTSRFRSSRKSQFSKRGPYGVSTPGNLTETKTLRPHPAPAGQETRGGAQRCGFSPAPTPPRVALERGWGAPSPRRTPTQPPKPSCWEPRLAPTALPRGTQADLGTDAVLGSCVYSCSEDAAVTVFWKFLSYEAKTCAANSMSDLILRFSAPGKVAFT